MKFNQISGHPRLYVSAPDKRIAYVVPAEVSSGATIEPADALCSDQLRGSFWFLPGDFQINDVESVVVANMDALVQAHGGSRLLIWSDRPEASLEDIQERSVILCMNHEGTAITRGCDVVLAGDALGLSIGAAGDLKFDPNGQVLQIGALTPLDLRFTGTQAPHGDMGQVTIPWAGAQLGHWQFELTTGSRE
ncbi:MAG: hypothetical protein WCH75_22170, partial [Candidatus Binatia bacterium]